MSPHLLIKFPSELTELNWKIEHRLYKKIYSASYNTVLFLLNSLQEHLQFKSMIDKFSRKMNVEPSIIAQMAEDLIQKNLLISIDEFKEEMISLKKIYDNLNKKTRDLWECVIDYNLFCHNFPFLDYGPKGPGWSIALDRMNHASDDEGGDYNRVKTFDTFLAKTTLPNPQLAHKTLVNHLELKKHQGQASFEIIRNIAALVFGVSGVTKIRWEGSPLILKINPSGGSRHPSEGYLINYSLDGTERGIFHIQSSPPEMVHLENDPNVIHFDKSPSFEGAILISSVFERNMFRYREPRTFRSVHLDVGHVLENLQLTLNLFSFETHIEYNLCRQRFSQIIKSDFMEEGLLAAIFFKRVNT